MTDERIVLSILGGFLLFFCVAVVAESCAVQRSCSPVIDLVCGPGDRWRVVHVDCRERVAVAGERDPMPNPGKEPLP